MGSELYIHTYKPTTPSKKTSAKKISYKFPDGYFGRLSSAICQRERKRNYELADQTQGIPLSHKNPAKPLLPASFFLHFPIICCCSSSSDTEKRERKKEESAKKRRRRKRKNNWIWETIKFNKSDWVCLPSQQAGWLAKKRAGERGGGKRILPSLLAAGLVIKKGGGVRSLFYSIYLSIHSTI